MVKISAASRHARRSDDKFKELIVYIAKKCEGDRPFGATKLNKLLFYADFLAYLNLGKSISGQEYQKLDHGPCPRRLKPILSDMENSGDVKEETMQFLGYKQKRVSPLREANLSAFSADEIALVDRVVSDAWGRTATDLSNLSHDFIGWKLAETGETIPYHVALVDTSRQPTDKELAYGKTLKKKADSLISAEQR